MKRLAIPCLALLSLLLLHFNDVALAAGFTLECKTLNPRTRQSQTTFRPRDDALLKVVLHVPKEAEGKQVYLVASMAVQIKSSGIIFSVPGIKIISPYRDPGIGREEESTPFSGTIVSEKILTIPKYIPPANVILNIVAAIKNVGKGTCAKNISVVT